MLAGLMQGRLAVEYGGELVPREAQQLWRSGPCLHLYAMFVACTTKELISVIVNRGIPTVVL
jgi:hypothetical protein